uniref:F-box protein CPR1-like isoform X2 n=1 Tax=Erigeron canadensis TaxID=72917 RepID=UPI001CB8F4A7|nr:F-box protein CPR1-like isoform X2 [Erigeron canadensis]
MVGIDDIPDAILCNIFSRLPAEPMGRCRCVSMHWNRLISDPSFMMSRSSRIFVSCSGPESSTPISISMLDESNGSVTHSDFSMFKEIPTIKNWADRTIEFIGTFSGIIILSVRDYIGWDSELNSFMEERMILYNPFTGVYEIFQDPYSPLPGDALAYGFGYGATPDELKLIRLRNFKLSNRNYDTCDVFNLKTRSWSQQELIQNSQLQMFAGTIGTFLRGYLYWMGSLNMVALNVDKMVFSKMQLPDSAINQYNHLGTRQGCLWMITHTFDTTKYDVWVKNEQGVDNLWSKRCSFTLEQLIIYDTSKQSYELLKSSTSFLRSLKYKESLIHPRNICHA